MTREHCSTKRHQNENLWKTELEILFTLLVILCLFAATDCAFQVYLGQSDFGYGILINPQTPRSPPAATVRASINAQGSERGWEDGVQENGFHAGRQLLLLL
jgi:hypothetical protein